MVTDLWNETLDPEEERWQALKDTAAYAGWTLVWDADGEETTDKQAAGLIIFMHESAFTPYTDFAGKTGVRPGGIRSTAATFGQRYDAALALLEDINGKERRS